WGDSTFSWSAQIRRSHGRGDYEFRTDGGGTVRRQGADFTTLWAGGSVAWKGGPGLALRMSGFGTGADRGSPGPYSGAGAGLAARLSDAIHVLGGEVGWDATPEFRASLGLGAIFATQEYAGSGWAPSIHRNRSVRLNPQIRWSGAGPTTVLAGAEGVWNDLRSTDALGGIRREHALYLGVQHVRPSALAPGADLLLQSSLRYDEVAQGGQGVSPRAGFSAGIPGLPGVRVRAGAGGSFRFPTFNELSWIPGGNPDLGPERSESLDAGASALVPAAGNLLAEATVFVHRTRDRIVWTPGESGLWAPRNIGLVRSRGLEVELRWAAPGGWLDASLNAVWNDVRKESEDFPGDPSLGKVLVFTPGRTFSARLLARSAIGTVGLVHRFVGRQFVSSVNDRELPSFHLTDCSLLLENAWAGAGLLLKLEVLNVFNTSYVVVPLYPMPLREYRSTVGVRL
ncbi:MAG: TonB-dependent receptor, partial [Bacteroidota bacterium]